MRRARKKIFKNTWELVKKICGMCACAEPGKKNYKHVGTGKRFCDMCAGADPGLLQ